MERRKEENRGENLKDEEKGDDEKQEGTVEVEGGGEGRKSSCEIRGVTGAMDWKKQR